LAYYWSQSEQVAAYLLYKHLKVLHFVGPQDPYRVFDVFAPGAGR